MVLYDCDTIGVSSLLLVLTHYDGPSGHISLAGVSLLILSNLLL